jgi:hypothetical protein
MRGDGLPDEGFYLIEKYQKTPLAYCACGVF